MNDENQSRSARNKNRKKDSKWFTNRDKSSRNSNSTFEKIFYILIALLFLLLVAFIIFIMNFSGNNTDNVSEDLVQTEGRDSIRELFSSDGDQSDETEENPESQEQTDDSAESTSDSEEQTDEKLQEDNEEDTEEEAEEETTEGDTSIINEDPPHDPSHAVDYSDGSSDRLEIRENVLQVTGIEAGNLTENWIGNDGPGRVEATVTDRSTGQQYVVYLSYGEGQWHVESMNPQ